MKREEKLQEICDRFNAQCPVGGVVTLEKDDGRILTTVTRSEAYVLSGHTPVIFVKGVTGCYALERVKIL